VTWWRPALAAVVFITAGMLVAWLMTTGPKRPASSVGDSAAGPTSSAPKADPPPPGPDIIVLDDFDRAVTRGLGRARVGGQWKTFGEKSERPDYAVKDSRGILDLSSPALRRTGYLADVSERSTDVRATFDLDRLPARGPIFVTVIGRRIDDRRSYATDLHITERGKVRISLTAHRNSKSGVTISDRVTVPGAIRARQPIYVRMRTFGVNPTQVQAKVWWGDGPEPTRWTVVKSDKYRTLQRSGAIGFSAYLSKAAINAPIRVSLQDITARAVPD